MKYTVVLAKPAQKQLDKLPNAVANSIIEEIFALSNNPRPAGCKKLKGSDSFRIRVGNYRVIYEIFDRMLIVKVIAVGHRKDIYE